MTNVEMRFPPLVSSAAKADERKEQLFAVTQNAAAAIFQNRFESMNSIRHQQQENSSHKINGNGKVGAAGNPKNDRRKISSPAKPACHYPDQIPSESYENKAAAAVTAVCVRKTLSLQSSIEKNDEEDREEGDDDDDDEDEEGEEEDEEGGESDNNPEKSSSRSPPVEFEYIDGRVHDRKVSEQVSEVIAIRYKLEPLRFEVECELGPVTEYVNDDQLGEDDDFDVDFDFQQQQQQQFQFDVQRPSESHNNNHQQQQGGEATSGRKGGEGRGRRPSALSLDMTLLNIASPLSPPPPGSPLSPSPLSPSQALKPELVPLCTIGTGAFGRVELTRHRKTGAYYALKMMNIQTIIDRKQVQHVHHEKRILQSLTHPFIVKMYDTAKDNRNLYMIMEFLSGGELFSYLRINRGFPSSTVKFLVAEVLLALEYLHGLYIAYRDLKPENLMLTHTGHIKLTDFGFAKVIHNKSFTLCGTPTYLAPEIYERKGHNQAVDFWALGVLIFELMTGHPPFRGHSAQEVQLKIKTLKGRPSFPHKTFSTMAKDIISGLLTIDPKTRLGTKSATEVKNHPWFERYDWRVLYCRNYKPPLVPKITHEGDTSNFDDFGDPPDRWPVATQGELDLFDGW